MPQILAPWDILTSSEKHPDREKSPECVPGVRINAADLAERVSKLLGALNVTKCAVSSGFRTPGANKAANGAKQSAHMTGQAVDLEDKDGSLGRALTANPGLLDQFDLYIENPYYTAGWVHLQSRPTLSGRRIFTP